MICSPLGQADFTASAVLQAIRSEVPRLHGLRLAHAANLACEKNGLNCLWFKVFQISCERNDLPATLNG